MDRAATSYADAVAKEAERSTHEDSPLKEFWVGLKSSLSIHRAIPLLYESERVRTLIVKCFLLNGVIFLGSQVLFNAVIRPVIGVLESAFVSEEDTTFLATIVRVVVDLSFKFFWIVPAYVVSFALNAVWYQDIADLAFRHKSNPNRTRHTRRLTLTRLVADEMYRVPLMILVFIEVDLIGRVPYIGPSVSMAMLMWIYSFYSFEYRWVLQGWSLPRRLKEIETRWVFFAGFGAPSTLLTYFFPMFVSAGIFALIFPIFILTAMYSPSTPPASSSSRYGRLPVFGRSKRALDAVVVRLGKLSK